MIQKIATFALGTLTELRILNCQNTGISDKGIEKLVSLGKLTHLDLRGTSVTDEAVFSLCQINSLRKVEGISGSAMLTLMDELPNFGARASR